MDKKLKIAFLSFYSGEIYRGVETYVHEVANRLVDLELEVTVYQNGKGLSGSRYKVSFSKMKVKWDKQTRNLYWNILLGKHAIKTLFMLERDTDVIVATNGGLQTLFCKIWCLVNGKRLIVPGQSGPGGDDKWNLLCFPDYFIALTNWQKEWANKFNKNIKIVVIPNGVDLNRFNLKVKSFRIDLPEPIILSVGALVDEKRLDLVIKAVSKTKASLLLVGKGNREKKLTDLANKLLPGRFKIMNFPHDEMPKVYPAADLFTYPTVPWESFGIVMVEAMASGLPIVATDDPIRREIIGNAGLFVDPTDTDKYAQILNKALETKWKSKPRQQAEKFDWDEIAKKYKELFESL